MQPKSNNTSTSSANDCFIGLMSGTSCDGIDAVAVHWPSHSTQPQVLATAFTPYPASLKTALVELTQNGQAALSLIGSLEQQLSMLYAAAALDVAKRAKRLPSEVTALGCHGQTIYHQPSTAHRFSWQLLDATALAHHSGMPVVSGFRGADIAVGGQGAPLAPGLHAALFRHETDARAVINLGGIANITLLPAGNSDAPVVGFDTGPGNGLIDHWVKQHFDQDYDDRGAIAQQGQCLQALLNKALEAPYFHQAAPKSTGREHFNAEWLSSLLSTLDGSEQPQDVLCTLVHLTAQSIAESVKGATQGIGQSLSQLYVCGGGAHNCFLIELLRQALPEQTIHSTEVLGLHPDWVEAVLIAWLAREYLAARPANLPSVTGASRAVRLGQLSLVP